MKSARLANIAGLVLAAAWFAAGMWVNAHPPGPEWLPKWALTFAVISPLAWIIIYTVQGVMGYGKWWRTDLGTNMVWMETGIIWTTGIILWAQWFNHGELNTFWQGWIYLGGVIAGGLVINWRSVIWLRYYRTEPGLELRQLREENAKLRAAMGKSPPE